MNNNTAVLYALHLADNIGEHDCVCTHCFGQISSFPHDPRAARRCIDVVTALIDLAVCSEAIVGGRSRGAPAGVDGTKAVQPPLRFQGQGQAGAVEAEGGEQA